MANKVGRNEARTYYRGVKERNTIYVWGMNYDTIISKESIDKAYKDNHTNKYNRAYYDGKLKEGKGKPGADCSGMHYKLSGYDVTAQNYYNRCTEKGDFSELPINDLVLLFKGSSKNNITHTGLYFGNGLCIHMKSSASNCVVESVDKHGWKYWGRADYIDYFSDFKTEKPVITRYLRRNCKGVDVKILQSRLNELKFNCGTVDGEFGSKTLAAVKKFQAAKKLEADGIVGPDTCKVIGFIWDPA